MPNFYIFHQNLRVFGGGTDDRNDPFEDACQDISDALGSDRVIVAGFTEVMNDGATVTAIRRIAQNLDPGLRKPTLFATGKTAVGGTMEWVAISTAASFTQQIAGKVLKMGDGSWRAYPTTQLAPELLPNDNFAADVRGLAYVGGTFNGQSILIGFIHNNYTLGEPTTIYRALPKMVEAIGAVHAGWDNVPRYLGGDFNIEPDNINVEYQALYARDEDGLAIPTTFHHPYDFWVTNDDNLNDGDVEVFTQTRWENNPKLSDHAGVGLQIA